MTWTASLGAGGYYSSGPEQDTPAGRDEPVHRRLTPATRERRGTVPSMPSDGNVRSVPLNDPFGFLEELCGGRVRDPVRHGVIRFLKGIRP